MRNNYFKVGKSFFFFFNGVKVSDTELAFSKAMECAKQNIGQISVFQLPDNPGAWDRCGIVGYRRRGEILNDIAASQEDALELEYRQSELERLDRAYYAAGRDVIPLFEVAA